MPDRGIINNRKGSVTSGRHDIVLVPGANRLTQEQFDKLMAEPTTKMPGEAKELTVVTELPPAKSDKPEGKPNGKPDGGKGDGGGAGDPADSDKTKK